MQHVVDTAPQANRYFSNAFPTCGSLIYYPGRHQAMWEKRQTYSIEGDSSLSRQTGSQVALLFTVY
jgi:hypothetical protein